MEWLACRVVTGKEYSIRKKILDKVPNALIEVPRKYYKEVIDGIVKTKSDRLLPGYILIGTESYLDPLILADCLKVIGKVSEEEYATLKAQEGQKDAVLDVGTKVLIIDGPFQGCKGNISSINIDGTYHCRLVFQGMELISDMKPELISTL